MSLVSAVATCGICGKLGSGFLSEKITARYTFCVLLLMQIVAMALFLLGTPDRAALWAALLIYGVGFGGIGAMLSLIVIDTCKYTSPLRDSPLKSYLHRSATRIFLDKPRHSNMIQSSKTLYNDA